MQMSPQVSLSLPGSSRTHSKHRLVLGACLALCIASLAAAQSPPAAHKQVEEFVDQGAANWKQVSRQIWDFAELGYHENKSSTLLQTQLKAIGG